MLEARWLFENHKKHKARLEVVELLLMVNEGMEEGEVEAEMIEALSLSRPPVDGLPRGEGGSGADRTGYAATEKDAWLRRTLLYRERDGENLVRERLTLLQYERLFYAIVASLSPTKRELALLLYDQRISINQLTQRPLTQDPASGRSLSTLKRMRAQILAQAQRILDRAPGE